MLGVFLIAAGGPVAAQETNEIFLDATYLGASTDWCPADAGVPVVIKMDGPGIIPTPENWPSSVRVRHGGRTLVVGSEEYTRSLQQRRVFDTDVIGRFSAEFQACQNPWGMDRVEGHWRIKASDGSALAAGALDLRRHGYSNLRFFLRANPSSDIHYAKFGDQTFFTASLPNVTTSQTFAAGTDKE
jgi:hypothetical protein